MTSQLTCLLELDDEEKEEEESPSSTVSFEISTTEQLSSDERLSLSSFSFLSSPSFLSSSCVACLLLLLPLRELIGVETEVLMARPLLGVFRCLPFPLDPPVPWLVMAVL